MNEINIKNMNKMAFPLLMNYFFFSLIGLVDQALLGHISLFAYGAAGLVVTTVNSITGVFSGIAIYFNIAGSGKYSQKKYKQLSAYFYMSLFLSIVIGFVISMILLAIRTPLLSGFFDLKSTILKEALDYYSFYIFTIGLNLVIFSFNSYYKIIGRTKWIFITSMVSNIVNILLDYLLIYGKFGFPALGAKGAAIASLIGLIAGVIIYLVIIQREKILSFSIPKIKTLQKIIQESLALMGQELLEGTLLVLIINALVSRIGELQIGIYNLTFYIFSMILLPMHAYGTIALTFISRKHENPIPIYKRIRKYSFVLVSSIYLFFSLIYLILNKTIPELITSDRNLIIESAQYIPLLILVYFFHIPQNLYKYILQGVGSSKFVFLVNLCVNFFVIGCWILLYKLTAFSLLHFYLILTLNSFLIAVILHFRFTKTIKT